MNVHTIYGLAYKYWREKRLLRFEQIIKPSSDDIMLDVGGYPATCTGRTQVAQRIDCLNLDSVARQNSAGYNFSTVIGDGCSLPYPDGTYEILFSNSVIEHVGDWDKQCAFAREVRRVGKKLWIQTPAYECPLEPHFLAPFVHWLPVSVRRRILRHFTFWGWTAKPSQQTIDEVIQFTQLLTKKQFRQLFPDCQIITERVLWIIPKSYTAYRC